MNSSGLSAACVLAVLLAAGAARPPAAHGQPLPPRIGFVCPAGGAAGQQGSTFEVTVGGQFLDNVANAYITGAGVKAAVTAHVKPITQKEFNDLREKLQELQKKPRDAETVKELADIREKMASFLRKSTSPAIAETVTLQVTVAPDAAPGQRELRLATPLGLSNPLAFNVSQLPEFTKRPYKGLEDLKDLRALRAGNPPKSISAAPPMPVTLPIIVNGQIMPGGVDRYRFAATKGQRLVIAAKARDLIPYIADAVPGWFQAAMTLYDADGHELAYADHFRFHPDPVLYHEVAKDGDYVLEVRDSLYRGREDFVYRISLGELPFVTGIFPLGASCPAGAKADPPAPAAQTMVELMGWNLATPLIKLPFDIKDKGPGVHPLSVSGGRGPERQANGLVKEWVSNAVPFAVGDLPEVLEKKPNNSQETAQPVTLGVVVNGRVDRAGEWSVFRFDGRAGDEVVAEVFARRLDSPLDSVLKLTDAAGKQLAFNDDHEDKGSGLNTHHADSYLRVKLPATAAYYVHLGDVQRQAGPEYAFRLRISPPQPDFELRVTPSSVNLRGSGTGPLGVYALRKDGFTGQIELTLKDAPAGFSLAGGRIPAGADQVRVTLTAPATPTTQPVLLNIEGRSKIAGREVVKRAVPAEDMMQAFAWRHLVEAQELAVDVSARFAGRAAIRILSPTAAPVKIPAGKTARVLVGLPPGIRGGGGGAGAASFQLELSDPPDGISIQSVAPAGALGLSTELVLACDAAKIKPGLNGNLIVNVFAAQRPKNPTTAPETPKPPAAGNQRRAALGTLPAIPFEVVAE